MDQDVKSLRSRLDNLLRMAKNNERKQENFQQYELNLLNSNGLSELITIILNEHRQRFKLTEVTLLLIDPEYEFRRGLTHRQQPEAWENRLLFTANEQMVGQYFGVQITPKLRKYSARSHQQLFPNNPRLRSVALLPLIRHNKMIGSLNLGSRRVDRFQPDIGTRFLQHLAAVISACIDNARLQENIKQVGLRDPLTGINNRRFFDQRIKEEVERAKRTQDPLSCLFIDLDHFKNVNDTHGHQVGDQVLQKVAALLDDAMRSSDVLARYGGEEFVILLADTNSSTAFGIAERIRNKVEQTVFPVATGGNLKVTLSIGLSILQPGSNILSAEQLIAAADKAVYIAKTQGRNQVYAA
jgi:diguanylate cyclase (GGDEF)-like protein